jgi:hypothetical protein
MALPFVRYLRNWCESHPELDDVFTFRAHIDLLRCEIEKERNLIGHHPEAETNIADAQELLGLLEANLAAILERKAQ